MLNAISIHTIVASAEMSQWGERLRRRIQRGERGSRIFDCCLAQHQDKTRPTPASVRGNAARTFNTFKLARSLWVVVKRPSPEVAETVSG